MSFPARERQTSSTGLRWRAWLERTANVWPLTEPARGGHYAPFEEPGLYAQELHAFFRPYRAAAAG